MLRFNLRFKIASLTDLRKHPDLWDDADLWDPQLIVYGEGHQQENGPQTPKDLVAKFKIKQTMLIRYGHSVTHVDDPTNPGQPKAVPNRNRDETIAIRVTTQSIGGATTASSDDHRWFAVFIAAVKNVLPGLSEQDFISALKILDLRGDAAILLHVFKTDATIQAIFKQPDPLSHIQPIHQAGADQTFPAVSVDQTRFGEKSSNNLLWTANVILAVLLGLKASLGSLKSKSTSGSKPAQKVEKKSDSDTISLDLAQANTAVMDLLPGTLEALPGAYKDTLLFDQLALVLGMVSHIMRQDVKGNSTRKSDIPSIGTSNVSKLMATSSSIPVHRPHIEGYDAFKRAATALYQAAKTADMAEAKSRNPKQILAVCLASCARYFLNQPSPPVAFPFMFTTSALLKHSESDLASILTRPDKFHVKDIARKLLDGRPHHALLVQRTPNANQYLVFVVDAKGNFYHRMVNRYEPDAQNELTDDSPAQDNYVCIPFDPATGSTSQYEATASVSGTRVYDPSLTDDWAVTLPTSIEDGLVRGGVTTVLVDGNPIPRLDSLETKSILDKSKEPKGKQRATDTDAKAGSGGSASRANGTDEGSASGHASGAKSSENQPAQDINQTWATLRTHLPTTGDVQGGIGQLVRAVHDRTHSPEIMRRALAYHQSQHETPQYCVGADLLSDLAPDGANDPRDELKPGQGLVVTFPTPDKPATPLKVLVKTSAGTVFEITFKSGPFTDPADEPAIETTRWFPETVNGDPVTNESLATLPFRYDSVNVTFLPAHAFWDGDGTAIASQTCHQCIEDLGKFLGVRFLTASQIAGQSNLPFAAITANEPAAFSLWRLEEAVPDESVEPFTDADAWIRKQLGKPTTAALEFQIVLKLVAGLAANDDSFAQTIPTEDPKHDIARLLYDHVSTGDDNITRRINRGFVALQAAFVQVAAAQPALSSRYIHLAVPSTAVLLDKSTLFAWARTSYSEKPGQQIVQSALQNLAGHFMALTGLDRVAMWRSKTESSNQKDSKDNSRVLLVFSAKRTEDGATEVELVETLSFEKTGSNYVPANAIQGSQKTLLPAGLRFQIHGRFPQTANEVSSLLRSQSGIQTGSIVVDQATLAEAIRRGPAEQPEDEQALPDDELRDILTRADAGRDNSPIQQLEAELRNRDPLAPEAAFAEAYRFASIGVDYLKADASADLPQMTHDEAVQSFLGTALDRIRALPDSPEVKLEIWRLVLLQLVFFQVNPTYVTTGQTGNNGSADIDARLGGSHLLWTREAAILSTSREFMAVFDQSADPREWSLENLVVSVLSPGQFGFIRDNDQVIVVGKTAPPDHRAKSAKDPGNLVRFPLKSGPLFAAADTALWDAISHDQSQSTRFGPRVSNAPVPSEEAFCALLNHHGLEPGAPLSQVAPLMDHDPVAAPADSSESDAASTSSRAASSTSSAARSDEIEEAPDSDLAATTPKVFTDWVAFPELPAVDAGEPFTDADSWIRKQLGHPQGGLNPFESVLHLVADMSGEGSNTPDASHPCYAVAAQLFAHVRDGGSEASTSGDASPVPPTTILTKAFVALQTAWVRVMADQSTKSRYRDHAVTAAVIILDRPTCFNWLKTPSQNRNEQETVQTATQSLVFQYMQQTGLGRVAAWTEGASPQTRQLTTYFWHSTDTADIEVGDTHTFRKHHGHYVPDTVFADSGAALTPREQQFVDGGRFPTSIKQVASKLVSGTRPSLQSGRITVSPTQLAQVVWNSTSTAEPHEAAEQAKTILTHADEGTLSVLATFVKSLQRPRPEREDGRRAQGNGSAEKEKMVNHPKAPKDQKAMFIAAFKYAQIGAAYIRDWNSYPAMPTMTKKQHTQRFLADALDGIGQLNKPLAFKLEVWRHVLLQLVFRKVNPTNTGAQVNNGGNADVNGTLNRSRLEWTAEAAILTSPDRFYDVMGHRRHLASWRPADLILSAMRPGQFGFVRSSGLRAQAWVIGKLTHRIPDGPQPDARHTTADKVQFRLENSSRFAASDRAVGKLIGDQQAKTTMGGAKKHVSVDILYEAPFCAKLESKGLSAASPLDAITPIQVPTQTS